MCKRFNVHYYSQSVEIYCNTLPFAKPVSLHSYAKLCRQKKNMCFSESFLRSKKNTYFFFIKQPAKPFSQLMRSLGERSQQRLSLYNLFHSIYIVSNKEYFLIIPLKLGNKRFTVEVFGRNTQRY